MLVVQAWEVLDKLMPAAGVKPDEVSFNTLLVLYGNAQDMDGAYRFWPSNRCPCCVSSPSRGSSSGVLLTMRPSAYAQGLAGDAKEEGHSVRDYGAIPSQTLMLVVANDQAMSAAC